eukprot:7737440-Pyramimonas_sp.AAC.1
MALLSAIGRHLDHGAAALRLLHRNRSLVLLLALAVDLVHLILGQGGRGVGHFLLPLDARNPVAPQLLAANLHAVLAVADHASSRFPRDLDGTQFRLERIPPLLLLKDCNRPQDPEELVRPDLLCVLCVDLLHVVKPVAVPLAPCRNSFGPLVLLGLANGIAPRT